MVQVQENIETARQAGVGRFTDEESAVVRRVQEKYEQLSPIPCTKCGYCLPCPHGVNIPVNFELYQRGHGVSRQQRYAVPESLPQSA